MSKDNNGVSKKKIETKEEFIEKARAFGYSERYIENTISLHEEYAAKGYDLGWDIELGQMPTVFRRPKRKS